MGRRKSGGWAELGLRRPAGRMSSGGAAEPMKGSSGGGDQAMGGCGARSPCPRAASTPSRRWRSSWAGSRRGGSSRSPAGTTRRAPRSSCGWWPWDGPPSRSAVSRPRRSTATSCWPPTTSGAARCSSAATRSSALTSMSWRRARPLTRSTCCSCRCRARSSRAASPARRRRRGRSRRTRCWPPICAHRTDRLSWPSFPTTPARRPTTSPYSSTVFARPSCCRSWSSSAQSRRTTWVSPSSWCC